MLIRTIAFAGGVSEESVEEQVFFHTYGQNAPHKQAPGVVVVAGVVARIVHELAADVRGTARGQTVVIHNKFTFQKLT